MFDINSISKIFIKNVECIDINTFNTIFNPVRIISNTTRDKQLRDSILDDFNIRKIYDENGTEYLNFNDFKSAINEVTSYYNNNGILPDTILKVLGHKALKKLTTDVVVPDKYSKVLYQENSIYSHKLIKDILPEINSLTPPVDIYTEHNIKFYSVGFIEKILDIKTNLRNAINSLEKKWKVTFIWVNEHKYYNATEIDRIKSEIIDFYNSVYLPCDIDNKFYNNTKKYIKEISINRDYTRFFQNSYNKFGYLKCYSKIEVDNFLNNHYNNYLSKEEMINFLNISLVMFRKYLKEYKFQISSIGAEKRYSKNTAIEILKMRTIYKKEHIFSSECSEFFSNESTKLYYLKKLNKCDIPLYMLDKDTPNNVYAYKRNDFNSIITKYEKIQAQKEILTISHETPYKTFINRLESFYLWTGFDTSTTYTNQKWFYYVKGVLSASNRASKQMNRLINQLVYCTVELRKNFLFQKAEIYYLTTAELNLGLRTISTYNNCVVIYKFLLLVYNDLQQLNIGSKNIDIKRILTPAEIHEKSKNENSNEIYSFQVYSLIFEHCINLKFHTDIAIKEIIDYETATYASTWLYSILHLNNAWRNGDVCTFPLLELSEFLNEYEINDIYWFQKNEMSLSMSRAIIFAVNKYELKINKTSLKGTFFCSDELAPSFATAVVILTLYNKNQITTENQVLMSFNTKYNEPTAKMLNSFFSKANIDGFQFKSKKFNKTILTFIYYIANLSGDSKALLYSMKLRGHSSPQTTVDYIQLNEKSIQLLGEQIFSRGEFGYIPTLLSQKLQKGQLSFDDITNEVTLLNESFGDLIKINATIGFINTLREEREQVYKAINEMSFEEAQELSTDLFARKCISKDSVDIQCLYSNKGCQRPDLNNSGGCFECQYHIPSIYVLDTLCNSIKKDIELIMETKIIPNKFKLALSIERKKLVLLQAIKKYGKDYVYSCIGLNRDDFKLLLASVPKPDDIIKSFKRQSNYLK